MPCSCCSFADTADQQFTENKVAKELRRYRYKGVGATTRLPRDGIARAGFDGWCAATSSRFSIAGQAAGRVNVVVIFGNAGDPWIAL